MSIENTTAGVLTPAELFLGRLRTETTPSHKKLESLPVSASILSPRVTVTDYAHYLGLMHDVVADTESRIFPMLGKAMPDLANRSKRSSLESDLAHSGISKTGYTPVFGDTKFFSEPFAMGILYVLEGSSLGGRFILNNISATIGFDGEAGARYFAGYGNRTGQMWKAFLQTLTDYASANECADEIIAGADFAFKAIHNHFSLHSEA